MRRKIIDGWEVEARERAESLRVALSSLAELEKVAEDGSMEAEPFSAYFSGTFNASIAASRAVGEWFNNWSRQAGTRVSPQAQPAFRTFSTCLPLLIGSVKLYAESLAVGILSSGESSDEELAAQGIDVAKQVGKLGLAMIEETPSLRKKHSREVDATLVSVTNQAPALARIMPMVSERASATRRRRRMTRPVDDAE